jgi:glycine cleavage system H protein
MSLINKSFLYTKEHEWVSVKKDIATIGITDYAQEELGDIVFVELPEVNASFEEMDEIGVIESVKTVSNLYSPLSGIITEINNELIENPDIINSSPFDEGWILKVKIADENELSDLLTAEQYETQIKENDN